MAKLKFDKIGFEKAVEAQCIEIAKDIAYDIKDEIKKSMKSSPEWTEKTYYHDGRKHHPSMPGNPPRVDYGRLHDSMSVNWYRSGSIHGEVDSRAFKKDGVRQPKAKGGVVVGTNVTAKDGNLLWTYLEYGVQSRNLKPRPFLVNPLARAKQLYAKHVLKASRRWESLAKQFIRKPA